MSARDRLRAHLLANVGRVIESAELQRVGKISEWARRVRELRDHEGFKILTSKDRASLTPHQYLLEDPKPQPGFARRISKELRGKVLDRNGYTCYSCGAAAGDPDPCNPGRKVRLTMGHIIDKSKGGTDTLDNLRAQCNVCNEGLQNIALPKPSRIELLKQIRRATVDDQREVLRWLREKFKHEQPK